VLPYFHNRWHYHPETELIYIEKGSGTQFIGDSIQQFKDGDLVLVGSCLPHYWRCDERYFRNHPGLQVKATVIHFQENFWGKDFLSLPESKGIRDLLAKARKGLAITGKTKEAVIESIQAMGEAMDMERLILLLKALSLMAKSAELKSLSSIGFQPSVDDQLSDRMEVIYNYSVAHFKKGISLEEIASVAHLSHKSFCRYFKSRTRKTYSRFLQELRVGNACKLLIENKLSLTQVCYESGFNNYANFYRYFKFITGKTPLTYQKEHVETIA
jgi:AraC-like DNA-binding protein